MSEPFDAYHTWLLIPPSEQPPDYYRLLGIAQLESDPSIIDAACGQRTTFIQSQLNGPHKNYAVFILNELQTARSVLMNPAQKQDYDARFSEIPVARLAQKPPAPPIPPTAVPAQPVHVPAQQSSQIPQFQTDTQGQPQKVAIPSSVQSRPRKSDQSMTRVLILVISIVGGGLSALGLISLLKPWIAPATPEQQVVENDSNPTIKETEQEKTWRKEKARKAAIEKRKEEARLAAENEKRQEEARIVHEQYLKERRERELAEMEKQFESKRTLAPLDGRVGLRMSISDSDAMIGSTQTSTKLVTHSVNFKAIGLTFPGTELAAAIDDNIFDHASVVADEQGNFELEFAINPGQNEVNIQLKKDGQQVAVRVPIYRVTGPVVRFTTTAGQFAIELFEEEAPKSVANFRSYVAQYHNSIIHHSQRGGDLPETIRGGLYRFKGEELVKVPLDDPVINEFKASNSNFAGSIAMVHPDGEIDGAKNQWLINMADNSDSFDTQSISVFGRVLGSIAALERIHGSPVSDLAEVGFAGASKVPLMDISKEQFENDAMIKRENLYVITFIEEVGDEGYQARTINFILN